VGALNHFALVAVLLAAPARAQPIDRWAGEIAEASARFAVPEIWIRRVIRAESGGQTMLNGRRIRSPAGAMGLMQLMPGTWRDMRDAYGLGPDPDDPHDNILAGTAYLRLLYERFGYPGLYGAYNAGPARYADHIAGRRRLPSETLAYLNEVTAADGSSRGALAVVPSAPRTAPALFAVLRPRSESLSDAPDPALRAGASLFAFVSSATAPQP
jgi:soluble lytic murein transglycosylase-like protein